MKTLLLTGGTRGIGKGIAEYFLNKGWRVILLYKSCEENAKKLTNVSTLFDKGLSNEDVLKIALDGIEYDLFDELTVEYKCDCTRERTERALFSIGKKEVLQILSEQRENGEEEKITLDCHFCNKKYEFTKEQALALFDKK